MKKIIRKKDGMNYFDLLDSLDAEKIAMDDQLERQAESKRFVTIRHDVDQSLDHALRFARTEYINDIRGTYYLLHTKRYFDYGPELISKCKEFIALGHSIGLHNNAMTVWLTSKRSISEIIEEPLNFLRSNGIPVRGTAAHGDQMCRRANYSNYEVWAECPSKRHNFKVFSPVSLAAFDLEYEAYFIRTFHISDGGNKFTCRTNLSGFLDCNQKTIEGIVSGFNKLKSGVLQVSIHPIWWEVIQ